MEVVTERLIDVLFELRTRNLIINCTDGFEEEICLYRGLGENIIDVVGREILLKPIIKGLFKSKRILQQICVGSYI